MISCFSVFNNLISNQHQYIWNISTSSTLNNYLYVIACCTANNGNYGFITVETSTVNDILYTADGGKNWTKSTVSGISGTGGIRGITCDITGQYVIAVYSGSPAGIAYSSNYGQTFVGSTNYYGFAGIGSSPSANYTTGNIIITANYNNVYYLNNFSNWASAGGTSIISSCDGITIGNGASVTNTNGGDYVVFAPFYKDNVSPTLFNTYYYDSLHNIHSLSSSNSSSGGFVSFSASENGATIGSGITIAAFSTIPATNINNSVYVLTAYNALTATPTFTPITNNIPNINCVSISSNGAIALASSATNVYISKNALLGVNMTWKQMDISLTNSTIINVVLSFDGTWGLVSADSSAPTVGQIYYYKI